MADGLTIRPAAPADAPVLCELLQQLGYPASESDIPGRLITVANFPRAGAFVAANGYGEVVGLVTTHIFPSIHDNEPVAWLTTLVVLEDARGAGIGSALVSHVEQWAAQNGAKRLSVTSGIRRKETHAFYEKRDYENTGLRFTKRLSLIVALLASMFVALSATAQSPTVMHSVVLRAAFIVGAGKSEFPVNENAQ
jgi:GNAT superfamily N-acetyltransferase